MNRYGQKTTPTPAVRLSPAPLPVSAPPANVVVPPAERARRRALCTRVILRAMKLKLAVAFAEWRCETINLNRERAIRQAEYIRRLKNRSRDLFLVKQVHRNMKVAFGMWRTTTYEQSKSREDLASELMKLKIENDELKNRVTLLEADTVRSEIVHQEVFEAEVTRVKDEGDQLVATVKAEKDKEIKDLICRRVILRALNSKLAAAFNEWSSSAKHIAKREKIVKKVVRVMQSKQIANAFRSWRVNAVVLKAQEAENTCMSLFKEKMELESSRRKQREEVARRALSRAISQKLFAGFQSWRKNVERIVKIEKLLIKTMSRLRKQGLNKGFRTWRDVVVKLKQKEAMESLNVLHKEKSLILSEFETEKERASEMIEQVKAEAARAAKERLARRVILKALNAKLAAGFRSWQRNVQAMKLDSDARRTLYYEEEISYRDRIIKQHEAEIVRLQAEKSFELQQHHESVASKRKEALCRRVVLRAMNAKMASGFSAWKSSVESFVKKERVMMRVAKTMTSKALSKSFRSWATAVEIRKHTERTRTEVLAIVAEKDALLSAHQAELLRIKSETESLIEEARREAIKTKSEAAERLEAFKAEANKSRREAIFRRFFSRALHSKLSVAFTAWKDNVAEIARLESLTTLADDNAAIKASYDAELKRLQGDLSDRLATAEKSRRDAICRRVILRALNSKLSVGFTAWRDNVSEIVRREKIVNRALKMMQNRSLSRSFRQWVSVYEDAKQERAAAATAALLASGSQEKDALKASYEAELKRVQTEAAERLEAFKAEANKSRREAIFRRFFSRALHSKLSVAFTAWKDNVAEIARLESLTTLADDNAAIKASYDAELKRLQGDLSDRLATAEKSRRDAICRRVILRALNSKLSVGFTAWRENVSEIVRREKIVNRALKMMQNRSLSRSFRQWASVYEDAKQERAAAATAALLASGSQEKDATEGLI
jgi:hypothetical protein